MCKQKSCKGPFCLACMKTPQDPTPFAVHDSLLNIMRTQNYFVSAAHPMLEEASCSFLSSLIFGSKSKAFPIACVQNYFLCTHMTLAASAQQFHKETLSHEWVETGFQDTRKMWKLPKCLSNIFYTQSKSGKVRKRLELLGWGTIVHSRALHVLFGMCHFLAAKKPSLFLPFIS